MIFSENTFKERRTDTHVYFVNGPFSQWWNSEFKATPWTIPVVERFTSCEQYMMASKALVFHDNEVFNAIMVETNPRTIKELGRKVRNFDLQYWNLNAREIVYRGNLAKFTQNPELQNYLLNTENRFLVEGAIYDPVWGVKLAWDDPAIEDTGNWQGTNWLGEVLMRVRDTIRGTIT